MDCRYTLGSPSVAYCFWVTVTLTSCLSSRKIVLGAYLLFYYPLTKSEGYSFGVVRLSIPSVRPHFLSVRNHTHVSQYLLVRFDSFLVYDKYHGLSISYMFGQNQPLNT